MTGVRHPCDLGTMPQFYAHDDLNTWMFVVFTEHYEHGDEQEEQLKIIGCAGLGLLKEYAKERMCVGMDWGSNNLLDAILNTIDYEALRISLVEWVEENVCETCHAYTDGEPCEVCQQKK